jgi:hypothetical protein
MSAANPYEKQAKLQRDVARPRGQPKIHNEHSQTPSRRGKVGHTLYFDVDTHRTLKELALEHETSVTALLTQGANFMLQHYGKKPIA